MSGTQVLVVGGGPVGLTLALDLARRGVRVTLVEQRTEALFLPKMEQCRPRTMEIYRRLGVADEIRAAGYPANVPMDAFIVSSLDEEPIAHWPGKPIGVQQHEIAGCVDGALPREPGQLISQYTLEPLLRRALERHPNAEVRFGVALVGFEQDADAVTAEIESGSGDRETITADYLVGCDGGGSMTRRAIGATLQGEPDLGSLTQALFHCPGLHDRIPVGRGRHYHFADDASTFLICQDDREHFSLHASVERDEDIVEAFADIVRSVAPELEFTTHYIGRWTLRLMTADRYRERRVFLAGDAAHLTTPTLGLGMNTGVGDADNLAWKLAAVLAGRGGENLLRSYETERRPVAVHNIAASARALDARMRWRRVAAQPGIAAAERRRLIAEMSEEERRVRAEPFDAFSYAGSPVVAAAQTCRDADGELLRDAADRLGRHLRLLWLSEGVALQDVLGEGFSLLRLDPGLPDVAALEAAFARLGVPLDVADVPSQARGVLGADLVLLRPDRHVAWLGERIPHPDLLAATVTGSPRP